MSIEWKTSIARLFIWLISEILLNLLGLDDLADYSEFVLEKKMPVVVFEEQKTAGKFPHLTGGGHWNVP